MIVDASTFQFRRSPVAVVVVVNFIAVFGFSTVGREVRRSGGKVAAHVEAGFWGFDEHHGVR